MAALKAFTRKRTQNFQDHRLNEYLDKFRRLFSKDDPEDGQNERLAKAAAMIRMAKGTYEDDGPDDDETQPLIVRLIKGKGFDIIYAFIIVANIIVIGLEADSGEEPHDRTAKWIALQGVFVFLFAFEIGCKVWYGSLRWVCENPIWNIPAVLILLLQSSDFLLFWVYKAAGSTYPYGGVMRMVSLLRCLWIYRLAKHIQTNRSLEEMRLMIDGIKASFIILYWQGGILLVALYIGAIFMTKEVGQNVEIYSVYRKESGGWDHEEYFGTVPKSMYTLFQCVTLDSWSSDIASHVVENQWYLALFFLMFLLLTTFGLLNVVVGVYVEHNLTATANNDERNRLREEKKKKDELHGLETFFEEKLILGAANSKLSLERFREAAKNDDVIMKLNELELPVEEAETFFQQIGGTGSKQISIPEFVSSCTRFKGPAMSKDMLQIQAQAKTLGAKMDALANTLEESEKMVGLLDEITNRIERRFDSAITGSRDKIANRIGGSAPVVPPKRVLPGCQEKIDLSIGNRPAVPLFPNLR